MSYTNKSKMGSILGIVGAIMCIIYWFYALSIDIRFTFSFGISLMTLPILFTGTIGIIGVILVKRDNLKGGFIINMLIGLSCFVFLLFIFGPTGIMYFPYGICYWGSLIIFIGGIVGYGDVRMSSSEVKEETVSESNKKIGNIMNLIGLLISIIGGTFSLIYGIIGLTTAEYWEESYFFVLISFSVATLVGDLLGLYIKRIGFIVSITIGFIGVLLVVVLGYGGWDLALVFPVILILIGGIISFFGWRNLA